MSTIKLVLFDALHTLITPRLPIHIQYAQVFEPYLGAMEPALIRSALRTALKKMQREKPVYAGGNERWWKEVVSMTAIGAGADPLVVKASLHAIAPTLFERFSGKEGYKAFDDGVLALKRLKHSSLQTGLVSNADRRIKNVLFDLGIAEYLDHILVSEEEGVEKPAKEIWDRACARAGVCSSEALYIGDELECDYFGARRAGLAALLVRRSGEERLDEDLTGIETIANLTEVLTWISEKI